MGARRAPGALSPDPELGDEGAIALHVGVPQVVQQAPLLTDQEKEAAARVVVLGVRLQVLRELPDPGRGQRDLDFGRTRVRVTAPVVRDQLALDFFLDCQTRLASIRGARGRRSEAGWSGPSGGSRPQLTSTTLPSERGSAPARHRPGPSITIACAWPNEWCFAGISRALPARAS